MDTANSFGTQDIITGRGLGIGGFGYGWGGGGGYPLPGSFARPEANAVRLNRNDDLNRERYRSTQFVLDQAEESRQFSNVCQRISDSELRQSDRARDIEREITQNARVAADCCCDTQKELLRMQAANDRCCCETQKLILENKSETNLRFAELARQQCEDKSEILAEIKAVESRNIERQLNATQAELVALKTQVACNCNCPS